MMEFTFFAIWECNGVDTCSCDYIKVVDGDGTTLMDKRCGFSSNPESSSDFFLPPTIMTNTNLVNIHFITDDTLTHSGWSVSWEAIQPGELKGVPKLPLYIGPFQGIVKFSNAYFLQLSLDA